MRVTVLHPMAPALSGAEHLVDQLFAQQPYVPIGALGLCVASAVCYAGSSVLQQREAQNAPSAVAMRLKLIGHLPRRPLWLVGNVVGAAALVLQFLALRHASLALVQPLLVIGLVFALAGGAALERRLLSRRETVWTATTMGGLALFLIAAQPGPGLARGSGLGWSLLGLCTAAGVGVLLLVARACRRWRALSLAVAAGLLSGVFSALLERTAHLFNDGIASVLTAWAPYVLVVCALLAITVTQSAYQAGDIKLSLPALTSVEPVVAILIGQLLFGEHISFAGLAPLGELVGLAVMTLGVFGLGRGVTATPVGDAVRPERRPRDQPLEDRRVTV